MVSNPFKSKKVRYLLFEDGNSYVFIYADTTCYRLERLSDESAAKLQEWWDLQEAELSDDS